MLAHLFGTTEALFVRDRDRDRGRERLAHRATTTPDREKTRATAEASDGGAEQTAPPMTAPPMFPVRGAWTLEAAGAHTRLYSPPPYRWFTNELTTFDVATGRMQTRVLILTNAAAARYPDGTVELFGDEATAARAVRCFDGTLYRPFAACAATARVSGKYTIDL